MSNIKNSASTTAVNNNDLEALSVKLAEKERHISHLERSVSILLSLANDCLVYKLKYILVGCQEDAALRGMIDRHLTDIIDNDHIF